MEPLPGDLPLLVGRQFVEAHHLAATAAVPAPVMGTPVPDIRQGIHLKPSVELSAPTMTTGVIKAISPNWHVDIAVAMTPPSAQETHVVGFTTRAETVLPPPRQARAHAHAEFIVLQTPAQTREFRFEKNSGMWGYWLEAMSIARIAGEWVAQYVAVPEEVPDLDRFYRGGHRHYINPDDAAELTAAGFGDYIRTEVRK